MYGDFDEADPLEIDVEVEGPDTAVFLAGDLDLVSQQPFWSKLFEAAQRAHGRLILDLSGLDFLDASGLQALLDAQTLLGERLVLRAPSAAAQRVLELTGLEQRFLVQINPGKVAYVRSLWEAFVAGGAQAMAELVPDQVKWVPWDGEGQVLHGSREMREFWAGRGSAVQATNFTQVGGDVVVRLEVPLPLGRQGELWSVYRFDGDRLTQAITFADQVQALDFAL